MRQAYLVGGKGCFLFPVDPSAESELLPPNAWGLYDCIGEQFPQERKRTPMLRVGETQLRGGFTRMVAYWADGSYDAPGNRGDLSVDVVWQADISEEDKRSVVIPTDKGRKWNLPELLRRVSDKAVVSVHLDVKRLSRNERLGKKDPEDGGMAFSQVKESLWARYLFDSAGSCIPSESKALTSAGLETFAEWIYDRRDAPPLRPTKVSDYEGNERDTASYAKAMRNFLPESAPSSQKLRHLTLSSFVSEYLPGMIEESKMFLRD